MFWIERHPEQVRNKRDGKLGCNIRSRTMTTLGHRCSFSCLSSFLVCLIGSTDVSLTAGFPCYVPLRTRGTRPANDGRFCRPDTPHFSRATDSSSAEACSDSTTLFTLNELLSSVDSLPPPPDSTTNPKDDFTRWIQRTWPLPLQHFLRDSGLLRVLMDGAVILSLPQLLDEYPQALLEFMRLSNTLGGGGGDRVTRLSAVLLFLARGTSRKRSSGVVSFEAKDGKESTRVHSNMETKEAPSTTTFESIQYGPHRLQTLDILTNHASGRQSPHRLILFAHGGAWGSGRPWMYRLVANIFLNTSTTSPTTTCAFWGYRTYPDGRIDEQMEDLASAIQALSDRHPDTPITIVAHSSGAHVSLLAILQRGGRTLVESPIQSMILLSGVYDIASHEEWERGRGIDQISPMQPVCGGGTERCANCSPTQLLCKLSTTKSSSRRDAVDVSSVLPPVWLLHGTNDDVVPYTSSTNLAKALLRIRETQRESMNSNNDNAVRVDILPEASHLDPILELMMGGPLQQRMLQWIEHQEEKSRLDCRE